MPSLRDYIQGGKNQKRKQSSAQKTEVREGRGLPPRDSPPRPSKSLYPARRHGSKELGIKWSRGSARGAIVRERSRGPTRCSLAYSGRATLSDNLICGDSDNGLTEPPAGL